MEINFARMDTGMHFSQAIPIVSEVKGWMAGFCRISRDVGVAMPNLLKQLENLESARGGQP